MKLAEALIKRADLQKKYNELRHRITDNVQVQDGSSPSENPEVLITEALCVLRDLEYYIRCINQTNSHTILHDNITITDGIAKRDCLKSQHELFVATANAATVSASRYSLSELKNVSVIDVVVFRKRADKLAQEFRELDTMIQGFNWNTDLIET